MIVSVGLVLSIASLVVQLILISLLFAQRRATTKRIDLLEERSCKADTRLAEQSSHVAGVVLTLERRLSVFEAMVTDPLRGKIAELGIDPEIATKLSLARSHRPFDLNDLVVELEVWDRAVRYLAAHSGLPQVDAEMRFWRYVRGQQGDWRECFTAVVAGDTRWRNA